MKVAHDTHHDFVAILKACGCLENWILLPLLASLPFHPPECMQVSICIEHYLCNLHPSYQSASSAFAVFLISLVLVELCWSPGISVHISLQSRPGRHAIPIHGAAQQRVVYQDAEECGEARWSNQNSIKPWNFEDQINILSVTIVKFQYS
jgi:hypothetical protein